LIDFSGERALRQILDDALRIADRCTDPDQREAIHKAVSDILSMTDALSELRSQGKVSSNFLNLVLLRIFFHFITLLIFLSFSICRETVPKQWLLPKVSSRNCKRWQPNVQEL
jgi:hypothetical protein